MYKNEIVRHYMNKVVITMPPSKNLYDASQLMRKNHIGCVVITDNNKPIGIITESSIVRQVASHGNLRAEARNVMSRNVITISPNENVFNALELMRRYHIRRLPIVENGILIGIVTQTNLLEASRLMISNFKVREIHLSEMATKDELTGLYNRRYFKKVFSNELQRARRFGGLLALVMLDIDHFKNVNDKYGHSAGDRVLQELSTLIKANARQIDVVARYGGEEFVVLLPAMGTPAAYIFAERLRNIVENHHFLIGEHIIRLTISGGICSWTKELNSISAMINESDKYLYKAKRTGRNRVLAAS